MRVVVTGASGQLGCALAEAWPEAIYWRRKDLDLAGRVADIRHMIIKTEADVVLNAAAYTAVDQAEMEPELAQRINAEAVAALADACYETGTRLLQVSTDYVFSGSPPQTRGWRPIDQPRPTSIYGGTKLLGEQAALAYSGNLVIRTSWVFGNGANFVRTMRRLGHQLEMVEVVDDQIGRPTSAHDLARAIRFLAEQPEHPSAIWHVQNSGPAVSWAEFAEAIFDMDGISCAVKHISTADYVAKQKAQGKLPANRPECSILDLEPLEVLGFKMPDWHDALKRYLSKNPPPT